MPPLPRARFQIPGAAKRSQLVRKHSFLKGGLRPGTPNLRPDASPLKLPPGRDPMEAFRYDSGPESVLKAIKTGRVVPELEELDFKRSFPFVTPGALYSSYDAMRKGGFNPFPGSAPAAPVLPSQVCTVTETYEKLNALREYVLQAHASYGLGDNGPLGPDEDDPHGDIEHIGMMMYVSDVLAKNEGLLLLSAKFADRPLPNVPHPADLKAIILSQRFIEKMLGNRRTPALRGPAPKPTFDAPDWKLAIARTRARHSRVQFDMVTQPDLRTILVGLGWDGEDHRCDASYVPRSNP